MKRLVEPPPPEGDWSPSQIDTLLNEYTGGKVAITTIAARHFRKRTRRAVKTKLLKLARNYRNEGVPTAGGRQDRRGLPFNVKELKILKYARSKEVPIDHIAKFLARDVSELKKQLKRSTPRLANRKRLVQSELPLEEDTRDYREFDFLEDSILAHRYLYYVKNNPILTDIQYDKMEHEAKEFDGIPKSSDLYKPGSDKEESYPPHVRALAMYLLFKYSKRSKA